MKATMEINSDIGWAQMAAFIVHTTAKMVKHLADSKGKDGGDSVRNVSGEVVGSWSIRSK
jgi:hypothetical protein